jgi:hypothetical protein
MLIPAKTDSERNPLLSDSTPPNSGSLNSCSFNTSDAELIRRQSQVAQFASFAVITWMFLPLLTGQIYVCDDLLNYHLPIRQFYADCLKNGDAFDWMPSLFSGFFLTGSGQAGTYHPWHWLLYRFLPLPMAFNLEILSSYPFMLFGMKLFLERHLHRRDAAWLGAIVFTFSGFCTLHFLHPNAIAVVSHLPWLLLALDVILRPRSGDNWRRVAAEAGLVLLTGSQLLLGYPQYVWFSLLAESVYCIGFATISWRGLRTLVLIAILKLPGLGLGAVQLLPSMDALAESDRTGMPAEYFFQHPLTMLDMLQWIGPFLTKSRVFGLNTHELGLYCGALPFLLATLTLCRMKSNAPDRRLVRVTLTLGLIALWLSFGKAGGLYLIQTWLPLIGKFRWPARIAVLLHLVVAILAAVGYSRLTSPIAASDRRLPRAILVIPALSLLVSFAMFFFAPQSMKAPLSLLVIGPILFILAAIMMNDAARGKLSLGFMLFVAGDLAAYGFTYEALNNTQSMKQIVASLKQPPGSPGEGRIMAETHLSSTDVGFGGNELLLAGWSQADGYEGLLPKTHLLDANVSLEGLRVSGVRWIVDAGLHSTIRGLKPAVDGWLEVPNPLTRVRLSRSARVVADRAQSVQQLNADLPPVVDPAPELNAIQLNAPVQSTGTARITNDRPGRIQIETNSASTELLVLSERWSAGWKVTVDDRPVQLLRAEVDFMGCIVAAGQHSVKFSFEPSSVEIGARISKVTLLLLLVYVAVRWMSLRVRRRDSLSIVIL